MSTQKLRHYFKAHTIKVLTNQLLNEIFANRDSFRRIKVLTNQLLEHVIEFEKHNTMKS
jgi:hypothetical protein